MIQPQLPPTLQRSIDQLTRNKHLKEMICITLGTASRTIGLKRRSMGWNFGSCSALACTRPPCIGGVRKYILYFPSISRSVNSHYSATSGDTALILLSVNCIQLATAPSLDCSVAMWMEFRKFRCSHSKQHCRQMTTCVVKR